MSYTITVICCVCKKVIGEEPGGQEPNQISHSYCDHHGKELLKEIEQLKKGRR